MELQLLLALTLVAAVESTPVVTKQSLERQKSRLEFCNHLLNVNGTFYSLEEQKNVSGIPADISVQWKAGKVYFTLISEDMKMNLKMMQLYSDDDAETIKVAGLGQSTTVDNLNDIVYLATDNGVYKYREDGTNDLYAAQGEDVMYLAVSYDGSTMYIATWPQNRVHKITNGGQKQEPFPVIPNGHGLTIDTRNNIYFVATKTTYVLRNADESSTPVKIKGLPNDKMTGVFMNRNDEVFAMDESSNLYNIDPDSAIATFLGSFKVEGVNTFGMDASDNVLIGVRGAILRFAAHDKNPCEDINNMYDPAKVMKYSKNKKISMTKPSKKGKRHNPKHKKRHPKTTTSTTNPPYTESTEEEED